MKLGIEVVKFTVDGLEDVLVVPVGNIVVDVACLRKRFGDVLGVVMVVAMGVVLFPGIVLDSFIVVLIIDGVLEYGPSTNFERHS